MYTEAVSIPHIYIYLTPQPNRQILSSGASSLTLAQLISLTTYRQAYKHINSNIVYHIINVVYHTLYKHIISN